MEGPFQSRTMARECRWVPWPPVPAGARRRPAAGARPCQLAGKATAGRSGTVINKIIIRNKPQALAECLHCHAGTAYPALGSLARQTWGCSWSPNHTRPGGKWARGHGRGEASSHPERGKSPCKPCLGDLRDCCRQGVNPGQMGPQPPQPSSSLLPSGQYLLSGGGCSPSSRPPAANSSQPDRL